LTAISSRIHPALSIAACKKDKINGNTTYKASCDKIWYWLLNGPIKNKDLRGCYEDIAEDVNRRTDWDCIDTIRYLLENRTDSNGYLEIAKKLHAWIEGEFVVTIRGFEPAEGVTEQKPTTVVMGTHSLNWASMLLDLAEATGDEQMRHHAIQTADYITYFLQPNNRIVVGFQYNRWWYSCHTGAVLYLFDFVEN